MKEKELLENNTESSEIELTPSDFEFVHTDGFGKIHDEKFKTKSTTFFKDAMKRFAKNKSSVVGAIIIAILMFGSVFVPIFSPYDTTKTYDPSFYLLPPKVTEPNKNGFWDGTVVREAPLDFNEELNRYVPREMGGIKLSAVVLDTMEILETKTWDHAKDGFYGGYINVSASYKEEWTEIDDNQYYFENYNYFKISDTSNTKVTLIMNDKVTDKPETKLGEYRVRLCGHSKAKYEDYPKAQDTFLVQDWSKNYPSKENPLVLDLSKALPEGKNYDYASIRIELKPEADAFTYFNVEKVVFSCADAEYYEEYLRHLEIDDCNHSFLRKPTELGCWCTYGGYNCYGTQESTVRFRYDLYEDQLGLKKEFVIGKTHLDKYIANGWCKYDWDVGPESFERLSDKCPIVQISENLVDGNGNPRSPQSITYVTDKNGEQAPVYQLTVDVIYYKFLGYDKMPSFFLGTDDSGRAMFTHALRCLKNSLAVSILCCAVTITIGLIWGSISGYYGGLTDLVMERITDILHGIPTMVLLTLVLLHMGKTLMTFAFAVCLTGWIGTAGLTRTQMYRFKNREYVFASRTLGSSDMRLMFKHILPNALGTIVTSSVLSIPGFVYTEASLAFLHLGIDSGDSFGVLISNNQANLSTRPALTFFPIIIICLLMISFNLFGNGLRDALNPTLKGGEQ